MQPSPGPRDERIRAGMDVRVMDIADVRLLVPKRHIDARGWFSELWRRDALAAAGIAVAFVQENAAYSSAAGTLRGLHYQAEPMAQAKLVTVVAGAIFDVAVDIRCGSPSFGQWVAATLTAAGGEQLFVPRGFAHGYCTLEPDTRVLYAVDNVYAPAHERGLAFDDPALRIPWPFSADRMTLSDRDRRYPRIDELTSTRRA
jgi:dTDP-4-dehydrorhamnose 3,5-epimerase